MGQPSLYELWPRQAQALRLLGLDPTTPVAEPVDELLFGGQSGGGKSYALRAAGAAICLRWPHAQVPLFRKTAPQLQDTHIRWVMQEIAPSVATFHVAQKEMRFPNGSVLMFRHAEEDADVSKFNTSEFTALLVDQAEEFSEYALRFLRHRVRRSGWQDGWHPLIMLSANPGGRSHQYLRDGFVSPGTGGRIFVAPEDDGGLRRAYLPSRLRDNPSLNAEQYRQVLQGLPEHLRKAYLEGDWSVVAGGYFSMWRATDTDGNPWHVWPEAYARQRYGVEQGESFPPRQWLRWAAVDFGVRDPWCVEFAARAPDRRMFVYRELYAPGVEVPQQAQRIRRTLEEHEERLAVLIGDPAGFNQRANLAVENLNMSDAGVYKREGVVVSRGSNKRQQGWRRVSELLSDTLDDGLPRLVVLEGACPNLVRTLPALLTDRMDHEDVSDEHGRADPQNPRSIRDDPADALRYLCGPFAAPQQDLRPSEIESRMGDESTQEVDPSQSGVVSSW